MDITYNLDADTSLAHAIYLLELFKTTFVDIDECSQDMCDTNAICINTAGSFYCECKEGKVILGHIYKLIMSFLW